MTPLPRLAAASLAALLAACGTEAAAPDAGPGAPDAGAPDAGSADPGANLSFEFPAIDAGGETEDDPAAWTVARTGGGTASLRRPDAAPASPAEGAQVAFVRVAASADEVSLTSASIATVEGGQRYTVRIATGAPASGERASLGLALVGGTVEDDSVTSTSVIGDLLPRGAFETHTLTWTAPASGRVVGQPLRVRVRASGLGGSGTAYVDAITLDAP